MLLDNSPTPLPARRAVKSLLWRLRPQLRELGDWDVVKELVKNTLARGNPPTGSARYTPKAAGSKTSSRSWWTRPKGRRVVRSSGGPARRYRVRAGDEAVGPSYCPRPVYADMVEFFRRTGEHELNSASTLAGTGSTRPA